MPNLTITQNHNLITSHLGCCTDPVQGALLAAIIVLTPQSKVFTLRHAGCFGITVKSSLTLIRGVTQVTINLFQFQGQNLHVIPRLQRQKYVELYILKHDDT